MASILYFGDSSPTSTSEHRARALERLGHTVTLCDPAQVLAKYRFGLRHVSSFHYHTGYRFVQSALTSWVRQLVQTVAPPDVVWVNSGEMLGSQCLRLLKQLGCPLVLYNNDDPTGGRDGRRFDTLLKSLSYYDLCVVMREMNIEEYKALGANKLLRVRMSYDEIEHRPLSPEEIIPDHFRSEVAFIGTWMPHERRDAFLLELIKRGVPISIWGNRWANSPLWSVLQPLHRGEALGGRDYVAAIQGAKICLGLLSKGNRDLHTTRSLEVPFAGGLLCAERTPEHLDMFEENVEAVFWSDAAECARLCQELLLNDDRRERIRLAGMRRVQAVHIGNEDVCSKILACLGIQSPVRNMLSEQG